LGLCAN